MKHTNQSLVKNMMDKNFSIWPTPNSGIIKKEKKIEWVLMSSTLYEINLLHYSQ